MILDCDSSIMESAALDAQSRLAARLRGLRMERGLTLEALAERAGVSRSMISLVERGASSPTAAMLDRLAAGLGVTVASLFADPPRPEASPLARREDQPTWRDPATGYLRRNLSPPSFPSPIELVEVVMPSGARVAYDGMSRAVGVSQQIWLLKGRLELTIGDTLHRLESGDCLAMRLDRPIVFHNRSANEARYLVALTTDPAPAPGARSGSRTAAR
jgi:transcriptional regulator with XRE-family HTH domain